jgi:hypothetical protein
LLENAGSVIRNECAARFNAYSMSVPTTTGRDFDHLPYGRPLNHFIRDRYT